MDEPSEARGPGRTPGDAERLQADVLELLCPACRAAWDIAAERAVRCARCERAVEAVRLAALAQGFHLGI